MNVWSRQLPSIDRLGRCGTCKQWLLINEGESWLPEHNQSSGERCSNSKFSPGDFKFFITSRSKAVIVANFIQDDNDRCLDGRERHSMSCKDGRDCEETRLLLAKALAEYVLALEK